MPVSAATLPVTSNEVVGRYRSSPDHLPFAEVYASGCKVGRGFEETDAAWEEGTKAIQVAISEVQPGSLADVRCDDRQACRVRRTAFRDEASTPPLAGAAHLVPLCRRRFCDGSQLPEHRSGGAFRRRSQGRHGKPRSGASTGSCGWPTARGLPDDPAPEPFYTLIRRQSRSRTCSGAPMLPAALAGEAWQAGAPRIRESALMSPECCLQPEPALATRSPVLRLDPVHQRSRRCIPRRSCSRREPFGCLESRSLRLNSPRVIRLRSEPRKYTLSLPIWKPPLRRPLQQSGPPHRPNVRGEVIRCRCSGISHRPFRRRIAHQDLRESFALAPAVASVLETRSRSIRGVRSFFLNTEVARGPLHRTR